MNIQQAEQLARSIMQEHGLDNWQLQFTHAKRQFGSCHYNKKLINLSTELVELNDEARVKNTILHEVAHALTPKAHHGIEWQQVARSIGCDGLRLYDSQKVNAPMRLWLATCTHCNKAIQRHKRIKTLACGTCCKKYNRNKWSEAYLFTWTKNIAS